MYVGLRWSAEEGVFPSNLVEWVLMVGDGLTWVASYLGVEA